MTWLLGMDEAGYGPNLGPFVMSAVACRVEGPVPGCLWQALSPAVRRAGGKKDPRLVVDDSKKVYGASKSLGALERGVWAVLGTLPDTLAKLVEHLCPSDVADLQAEVWFAGATSLPQGQPFDSAPFRTSCEAAQVREWRVVSTVVCPDRFNRLTSRAGTKSVVLADGFVRLLSLLLETCPGECFEVTSDKQGSRNTYLMQVQQAAGGLVRVVEESDERSRYEAVREERRVSVTFEPRADGANLCVALASMVSKYVRELCMSEFNAFWRAQVPGLAPTAGYPGDAPRYLEAISEAAKRLEVSRSALWREK